jgi:hypothetical protein
LCQCNLCASTHTTCYVLLPWHVCFLFWTFFQTIIDCWSSWYHHLKICGKHCYNLIFEFLCFYIVLIMLHYNKSDRSVYLLYWKQTLYSIEVNWVLFLTSYTDGSVYLFHCKKINSTLRNSLVIWRISIEADTISYSCRNSIIFDATMIEAYICFTGSERCNLLK